MSATNPYSASHKRKVAIASRTGAPLTDGGTGTPRGSFGANRSGTARASSNALVASNGEFNAGNKRELMQAISTLHGAVNSGEVETKYHDSKETVEVRAAQQQRLVEAWNDRSGQSWQALGKLCPAMV